jgi:hypothetical protein
MNYRIIVLLLLLAPFAAQAQSFRCVGKDGKKYYGSAVPPQCAGAVVEQLSAQGAVIRRIDPALDAKAREDKAAGEAKKQKEDATAKDAARRRNALLATYANEKEIEDARARDLADNARSVKDLETRIAAAKNFKPTKKGEKAPNVGALENMLERKRQEVPFINAKYDETKKKYVELLKK